MNLEQLKRSVLPKTVKWFDCGLVGYDKAWSWQKELVKARVSLQSSTLTFPDIVIALEHPHVFTLGRGATEKDLRFDIAAFPRVADVHRVERGGQVTYHGPGQLVVYPVLQLQVRAAYY